MLTLISLALAAPISIPVHGTLADADGAPANGARTVKFTLYGQGGGGFGPIWSSDLTIALADGTFTAVLEGGSPTLDATLFRDNQDIRLSVWPAGDAESALVPVGAAPLAAYAALAGDAATLGGRAPDDYVRGDFTAGNAAGSVALNNGTLNATLNADLLDGYSAGNATGALALNNGTLNTDLNADRLDGLDSTGFVRGNFTAGNASGNVAVSNGTVNANFNADLLDGLSSGTFARLDQANSFSGAGSFTGRITGTGGWPQIEASPPGGNAYLAATRASAAAGDVGLALRTGAAADWYLYEGPNSTTLKLNSGNGDRVWFDNAGNVGVGGAPSARLHVTGGEIRGETIRNTREAFGTSFTFPADGAWRNLYAGLNGHQLYEIVADYGTSCYHSVGHWYVGNTYASTFVDGTATAHGGVPIQVQWVGSTYDMALQIRSAANVVPCGGGGPTPTIYVRLREISWD